MPMGMAVPAIDGDQAGGPAVAIIMGSRQAGLDPGQPLGRALTRGPDILGSGCPG